MIKSLSILVSEYLRKNNDSLTKTDLLKIQYSLQVILGDLSKVAIISLIFLGLNEMMIFSLSLAVLFSTRPLWGGPHCKTYISCLMCSTIYFLTVLMFIRIDLKLNLTVYIISFIIFFVIILAYAPCHNEKRPIKNKKRLKVMSLISLAFWSILFFKLSSIQMCNCIFVSILLQIIQVIIFNMKGVFLCKNL